MFIRLSFYMLLLCVVPLGTWLLGWQWQNDTHLTNFDYFLYLLTETGSVPYALITCGVFALLFYPIIGNRRHWIIAVGIMALSMLITQGLKTGLKTVFAEPRPFIQDIAQKSGVSTDYFYDQSRKERGVIVSQFYEGKTNTPSWLIEHRESETGYSFPSGHTIFAAAWLFLTVGFTRLFNHRSLKAHFLLGGMTIWAVLMLVSRLRLGMHYPIDLLISTLIAWLIHCSLFFVIEKKEMFK
ncbi:MAG: phosphatase PAP2 family protein [Lonepinella koalarum]|nr:phosphatase PAP2 family protein [Lonepinella koalarum]